MPSIQQLKLLINLARMDGDVAEKERQYIINIGQANHLLVAEILPLFSGSDSEVIVPSDLNSEEKFEYIFSLIQLTKIDEKVYRNEIKYCAQVASALGYRQDVLFELMLKVKSTAMEKDELEALKKLTATYLLHS
ncbi:MAG: TerB family tellurite resistance protein [Cyclobacteriaceae bacterium]|nr:TerB family tellurite resistance protein [Cyclobacteriaceae bacterium]